MSLRINPEPSGRSSGLVADRRIYRGRDGTPCERTDLSAAYLLAGKGKPIPADVVDRYDMRMEGGRVVWGPRKPERPAAPEPVTEPDPEVPDEAPREPETEAPEWHLKTPPDEYLTQYPNGPNAALARLILGESGG